MVKLGNNIFISTDGTTAIAATRSNEIIVDGEAVEIANVNDREWKDYLAGRKSWTVTVSFLVSAVKDGIRSPLSVGSTYTLYFMTRDGGTDSISGQAICIRCKITSTKGSVSKGSIMFQGKGRLQ